MAKRKYATDEERWAAVSEKATRQMTAQWERQRDETGEAGPGYFGRHRRVRKARGRAGDQMCTAKCGRPARHRAQIHGTDGLDPFDYQAMCQKCHWAYDRVGERVVETKGPEGRRNIALKAWETKRARAALSDGPDGL